MSQKLLVILLSLAAVAAVSIALYQKYFRPSPTAVTDEGQKAITVTAQNGQFSPDTFTTQLFEILNLNVSAVDQDYNFQVSGYPRLDSTISKGQTATIKIESLGVGEYPFTCGPDCTGKIIVEQQQDDESGEED